MGNDKRVRDITHDILTRWTTESERVPSTSELRFLLNEPLSENEKVPIRPDLFAYLLLSLPTDICTEDDVRILFRESDTETSPPLQLLFSSAITNPTPPESGSESSFIALWDDNVRRVLDVLVPTGVSIRGPHKLRPDFGFVLRNLCLFWGEEKAATDTDDSKAELCDRLAWIYNPAPYVFGEPIAWPIRVKYSILFLLSSLSCRRSKPDPKRNLCSAYVINKTICRRLGTG